MPSETRPDRGADLILTGGRVLTMDPGMSVVEALAVSDGFVSAVGRADDILEMAGSGTETIDIGGLTAVPGFNDTHAHMDREGLKSYRPSLEGATSVPDVLDRIAKLAAETPPGEWIVTMPVGAPPCYFGGPESLAEGRMPTRGELDAAAPDNPVLYRRRVRELGCATRIHGSQQPGARAERHRPAIRFPAFPDSRSSATKPASRPA